MRLRDVQFSDVDAYVRMRCDPVMMAELGGPTPREGIEEKVRRDVGQAAADVAWIKMIVPDDSSSEVAGSVVLWPHEANDETISEIGWMVLPKFQGQGLGKHAVRVLLEAARDDGRWGLVHAFPRDYQCGVQRHMPVGRFPAGAAAGCHLRRSSLPDQPLGH